VRSSGGRPIDETYSWGDQGSSDGGDGHVVDGCRGQLGALVDDETHVIFRPLLRVLATQAGLGRKPGCRRQSSPECGSASTTSSIKLGGSAGGLGTIRCRFTFGDPSFRFVQRAVVPAAAKGVDLWSTRPSAERDAAGLVPLIVIRPASSICGLKWGDRVRWGVQGSIFQKRLKDRNFGMDLAC
jgi:hypothetical protein